jgi:hypothetical protein
MTTTNSISYDNLELFDVHLGSAHNNNCLEGITKPIKYNRSLGRTRVKPHLSKRRSATPYPHDKYAKAHPANMIEENVPYVEFDINQYYSFLSPNRKDWLQVRMCSFHNTPPPGI